MLEQTVDRIVDGRRSQPHQLIEVLLDLQDTLGYLPQEALKRVSEELGVPLITVYRAAHFYKVFSLKPRGKNIITICTGTACHVRGADLLIDQAKGQLKVEPGETTEDGLYTLESVNCVGACALGPIIIHNEKYSHRVSPGKLRKIIDKTGSKKQKERADG